jgi:hypothetical protein
VFFKTVVNIWRQTLIKKKNKPSVIVFINYGNQFHNTKYHNLSIICFIANLSRNLHRKYQYEQRHKSISQYVCTCICISVYTWNKASCMLFFSKSFTINGDYWDKIICLSFVTCKRSSHFSPYLTKTSFLRLKNEWARYI